MKDNVLVARQPIIDRRGSVVAYELLFRNGQSNTAIIHDGVACSAAVVERALGAFGLENTLGEVDGFINCPAEFLLSGSVDLLPPRRFVLEILEDACGCDAHWN
ncbi:hypothetical protein [Candidatus Burkholderia verschuerenii]|uniref:hypothetical protein n=1 Tax=Candidatus Burkholderia verschuerenii TaxID=242163 RepID=UPI0012ED21FD|nr:hypothetical protein [Candidatus Burkholderia verschuerenii]